jgi:hypothetical protein
LVPPLQKSKHSEDRHAEARAGDTSREVGDMNRVVREGRKFYDTDTGYTIYVSGDRVVIVSPDGTPITQLTNPRANTQTRIRSGKWIPQ